MAPVTLKGIISEFELEVVTDFGNFSDVLISVADVTRPGLQLAGYFDHFGPDRIQVLGNMETAFLDQLSSEERMKRLDALFSKGIPCLILSRNHQTTPEMLACSEKYRIPILRTGEPTAAFVSSVVKFLNVELAPRMSLHGVLVEVYGEGILILGESGVGGAGGRPAAGDNDHRSDERPPHHAGITASASCTSRGAE